MFSTKRAPKYDYLTHERINILADHGYCGFKISEIKKDPNSGEVTVFTKNDRGISLSVRGQTMTDACKKMIDSIEVLFDDY